MTAPGQNLWDSSAQTDEQDNGTVPPSADAAAIAYPSSKDVEATTVYPDQPRRGISIRIKAMVLAALFGVAPVLVVSFIGYRSANSSITETVAEQELEEVDQIASQLSTYLQERITNVKTISAVVTASPLFEGDSTAQETRLEQALSEQLTKFVEGDRTYTGIGVYDLEGNLRLQSLGASLDPKQGDVPYFIQAIETETATVSEPVPTADEQDSPYSVYVTAPITDQSEDVRAVLVAQIPVSLIGDSILGTGVSEEEEEGEEFYRLIDSSGNIIQSLPISTEDVEIGSPLTEKIPGFEAVQASRELQTWIGPTAAGEALIAYAPVSGVEGLNWSVVASETTAQAFEAQQQLLKTILAGTAITGIIAVLLGVLLAERTTQPIERVAKTVELLGQGDLRARVLVQGNDELAVLGHNVNRMAGQIQALLQTLSQNANQLDKQNNVLADLARNEALIRGDVPAAVEVFAEATANTLNVERASVWVYNAEVGEALCINTSDQSRLEAAPAVGGITSADLRAIAESQGRAIRDVSRHSKLQALQTAGHLDPNTVSVLEVPIQIGGTVVGLLRCEHQGECRDWKPQEQLFVSSVANLVAIALESEVLQKEVDHLLDVVSEVEDGNLTIQALVSDRSTGLVADTFNRLVERLTEVLQQTLETAQQAYENAQKQKSQAARIASNAEQQAQGVNQVLRFTDEVKVRAQDTARQVEASRASLQTLQKTVEQGKDAVTTVTAGIDILQEDSDRIIQQMKTLGEFVGLADQFVQDQTQIASLTQTLALNASLVAARAAEQRDPRQFAVAAREFGAIAAQVSQLAQQTNDSLTTLEQRSTQIQSVVFAVDANVQRVGSLVDSFTRGVEQSNRVFENVQVVTLEAVDAEEAVARASQEIIDAVQSATDVVRTITDITAQTANLTQNNRTQSEQMEILSGQLLQTIAFFQLPPPLTIPRDVQSSLPSEAVSGPEDAPTTITA